MGIMTVTINDNPRDINTDVAARKKNITFIRRLQPHECAAMTLNKKNQKRYNRYCVHK